MKNSKQNFTNFQTWMEAYKRNINKNLSVCELLEIYKAKIIVIKTNK